MPTISFIDTFFVTWNGMFMFIFFIFLFFLFFRLFLLFYTLKIGFVSNRSSEAIASQQADLIIFLFFFWTIQPFVFVTIWSSPELFLFSNHITFRDTTLLALKAGIFMSLIFFRLSYNWFGLRFWLTFFTNAFFISMSLASATTTLYSFAFSLELINLTLVGLLYYSSPERTETASVAYRTRGCVSGTNKFLNSVVVFFWINALSSIALLLFVTLTPLFGSDTPYTAVSLTDTFSGVSNLPGSLSFFVIGSDFWNIITLPLLICSFFLNDFFFFVIFFLILFFFKLGLPPFIVWKSALFKNASVFFLLCYAAPYTFFLLLVVSYLIGVFFLKGVFIPDDAALILLVFIVLSTSSLFAFTENINLIGDFLAVSSAFTSLFVFTIFSGFVYDGGSNIEPYWGFQFLFSYVLVYALTLTLLLVFFGLSGFGSVSGTCSLNLFKRVAAVYNEREVLFARVLTSICYFSLAGLPPLLPFFIKLILINSLSGLVLYSPSVLFFLILIFLFLQLVFYFRLVKFSLTPQSDIRLSWTPSHAAKTTLSKGRGGLWFDEIPNNYPLIYFYSFAFFIVFGGFFLGDFLILTSIS